MVLPVREDPRSATVSETGLTVKALLKALDKAVHGLAAAPRGLGGVVRSVVVAGDSAPVPAGALVVVPPGGAAALAARPGPLDASAVAAVDGDADGLRGLGLPVLSVDPAVGTDEFAALARSLWIRSGIDETPSFKKAKEEGEVARMPVVETFRFHWRAVLVAVGAKVVETAPFYIFGTFVVSYATGTLSFDNTTALNAVTVGAIVATVCIPIAGRLSDTFGRQRVYLVGAVLLALFIAPYFLMLGTGSTSMLILATVIGLGVLWAPVTATIGTLCSEIFSTRVRYTGVTLGYQIGAAAAGGTAPLIATWLLSRFDDSWVPVAGYLIFTAVVSVVAVSLAGRASNAEERHLSAARDD